MVVVKTVQEKEEVRKKMMKMFCLSSECTHTDAFIRVNHSFVRKERRSLNEEMRVKDEEQDGSRLTTPTLVPTHSSPLVANMDVITTL